MGAEVLTLHSQQRQSLLSLPPDANNQASCPLSMRWGFHGRNIQAMFLDLAVFNGMCSGFG
jgi:hypothetical protein